MQELSISYKKTKFDYINTTLLSVIICIIFAVLIVFIAFRSTYVKIHVDGVSMEETLKDGDYVYMSRYNKAAHGDIVVVQVKSWDSSKSKFVTKYLIKRVIAKGGDTVKISNGVLYLNGKLLNESYVVPSNNDDPTKNTFPETGEYEVPEGYVFILGDNRDKSNDSRLQMYQNIKEGDILGVVADWSIKNRKVITFLTKNLNF